MSHSKTILNKPKVSTPHARIEMIRSNWGVAMQQENFALKFSINIAACFIIYMLLAHYLFMNRLRTGTVLGDPLLRFIAPVDFSWPIFILLYSSVLVFVYYILPHPRLFMFAARACTALFVIRVLFITLTPLGPPYDAIPLRDPFIDKIIGFKGEVLNDLFFSGHVSDLYLFAFCCEKGWIRKYLFSAAILVSVMIVWQKVHYSTDVLAAPFFSYCCYALFVKNKQVP